MFWMCYYTILSTLLCNWLFSLTLVAGDESPRSSQNLKAHFRRKKFQSPQLRARLESILQPPPSSLVEDLLWVHICKWNIHWLEVPRPLHSYSLLHTESWRNMGRGLRFVYTWGNCPIRVVIRKIQLLVPSMCMLLIHVHVHVLVTVWHKLMCIWQKICTCTCM